MGAGEGAAVEQYASCSGGCRDNELQPQQHQKAQNRACRTQREKRQGRVGWGAAFLSSL